LEGYCPPKVFLFFSVPSQKMNDFSPLFSLGNGKVSSTPFTPPPMMRRGVAPFFWDLDEAPVFPFSFTQTVVGGKWGACVAPFLPFSVVPPRKRCFLARVPLFHLPERHLPLPFPLFPRRTSQANQFMGVFSQRILSRTWTPSFPPPVR